MPVSYFVVITISGLTSERGLAVTWRGNIGAPSDGMLLYDEAVFCAKKHFRSKNRSHRYSEFVVDFYRAVRI